jgi:aryl-alcohol dehydrogenase-like predicted oxidoreductase
VELTDFRTLGRTGLRVSPLALGTMTFGDPGWGADEETSIEILKRYLDAGGNFIDTANAYMGGRSEEVIGRFLGKDRDRVVLATKFALSLDPADPNNGGTGRKAIHRHVDDSLRRLGTDYLDLYWQHNWDRHTPLEETMSTLDDLIRAGKVRYAGLSDTPAWAVNERTWAAVDALQRIDPENPAAVALAWVRQQNLVTSTVLGARTVEQLDANLASLKIELGAEQLSELDALTTPDLNFPHAFLHSMGFPAQQGTTSINGVTTS